MQGVSVTTRLLGSGTAGHWLTSGAGRCRRARDALRAPMALQALQGLQALHALPALHALKALKALKALSPGRHQGVQQPAHALYLANHLVAGLHVHRALGRAGQDNVARA